ncbi:MAG: sel1 repeat family protein, partial [bacterium]|nr:sel1 repeat family protein [bacterium]
MSLHARRAFPFFISLALLSGCAADSATPTDSGPVTTGVDVAGEKQLDLVGLFEKAKALAETGSVEAKMQLAVLYNKGVGTPVNHERACELFREVAETGLAEAQAAIGICLMSDKTPDGKAAEHWLQLAAAQGVAGAHFNLALLYLRGTGIEANRTKGTRWARSAVALKHDEAQRLLEALDANARDHWYVLPAPEDL